ncbi:aldehyde dehydrogenase family protein [Natronospirillum operosum]|uniref:Aldehyde dehydrogenase family protein n=1 Tax=Natronospirillum operosum TaxID=2759953 RepID=A0A4Z0WA72_9GAMM|nr:aldehyde dehydrogenase family protein [Natronospirillum operosum]TGG95052.1 aldehyde dehydrogenase family protein [Natronospirillum operosum]
MQANHWINGEWLAGNSGTATTTNPADGEVVGEYALGSATLAREAVAIARRTFEAAKWSTSPRLRASVLLAYADRIAARKDELAAMIVAESGKLQSEAVHEVMGCISECRYYAGLARTIAGRVTELDTNQLVMFNREAAGVAAIIVPWNAPATLLIRSLAPALAAGCTVVVKPAPQTANVNRIMMECLAGVEELPAGVVNSVNENGIAVGQALTTDPEVDVISFTGASSTGKAIMKAASGTLKRLSLELGGKAPTLVCSDADLNTAIPVITRNATILAGQMCTAITRVVVAPDRFDEVAARLITSLAAIKTGRGDDPTSTMGAIIDRPSRDRLLGSVQEARKSGEILLEGTDPGGPLAKGAFITPSLIHINDVSDPLVQEELFGPVLNIERATDEHDMLARANATRYGLAASVWTRDVKRAQRLTRHIRAGSVWVNTHNRLGAETETGGFKHSGLGRLHGVEGLNDFLETKTVFYETDDEI